MILLINTLYFILLVAMIVVIVIALAFLFALLIDQYDQHKQKKFEVALEEWSQAQVRAYIKWRKNQGEPNENTKRNHQRN